MAQILNKIFVNEQDSGFEGPVQGTGQSTNTTMSQKAVTDLLKRVVIPKEQNEVNYIPSGNPIEASETIENSMLDEYGNISYYDGYYVKKFPIISNVRTYYVTSRQPNEKVFAAAHNTDGVTRCVYSAPLQCNVEAAITVPENTSHILLNSGTLEQMTVRVAVQKIETNTHFFSTRNGSLYIEENSGSSSTNLYIKIPDGVTLCKLTASSNTIIERTHA